MEPEITMDDYFGDYPAIQRGLRKLKISRPTDFQQQLLDVSENMDNLIITAPEASGKTVGLLLHTLRKFSNEEEGIMVVLAHSKDLSQQIHHFLTSCMQSPVVNLYMQDVGEIAQKTAIVGSPLQVNNLWKKEKDKIIVIAIPEVDMLYGFGYGDSLELLAGSLNPNRVSYKLACISRGPEIEKFKSEWMKKAHRIDYEIPEEQTE
jgi:superfamily II DNA/RNA helicase